MIRHIRNMLVCAVRATGCAWLLAAALLLSQAHALEHDGHQAAEEPESCSVCLWAESGVADTHAPRTPLPVTRPLPQRLGTPGATPVLYAPVYASRAPPRFATQLNPLS